MSKKGSKGCPLGVLRTYLEKTGYLKDDYESVMWDYDHIVHFCRKYQSCERCPWYFITVIVPSN